MTRSSSRRISGCRRRPAVCAGIISSSGVQIVWTMTAPYDHFLACPDCPVILSGRGRVSDTSGRPTIFVWVVSAASVGLRRTTETDSTPDDHLAASPHCGVTVSRVGSIDEAGSCPTVGAGIVSAACTLDIAVVPTPNNHFAAAPNCGFKCSAIRRVCGAGGCPAVCAWIVYSACGCITNIPSAPYDHFTAAPDCYMQVSRRRRVRGGRSDPTVGVGIIFAASVESIVAAIEPAPDDHLVACPDGCVQISATRRVCCADGCPTVRGGIISLAAIRPWLRSDRSSPDDHFTPSPNCCVKVSAKPGRRYPAVGAWIISPASVEIVIFPGTDVEIISTPNDHRIASPYCRVLGSRSRRVT